MTKISGTYVCGHVVTRDINLANVEQVREFIASLDGECDWCIQESTVFDPVLPDLSDITCCCIEQDCGRCAVITGRFQ